MGVEVNHKSPVGKLVVDYFTTYATDLGLEKPSHPSHTKRRSSREPFMVLTSSSSLYDALFFTRAYMEVLIDRFPKLVALGSAAFRPILNMSASWPPGNFIKYAKYCTAYPMAFFLTNPTPVTPDGFTGSPLFSGYLKKLLKNRLLGRVRKSKNNLDARLFFGILQGVKRACAPVTEAFVHDSFVKHRKALVSPPRGSDPVLSYYARALHGFTPPPPKLYEASASASYEAARSAGGGRGLLQSTFAGPFNDLIDEELINMYGGGRGPRRYVAPAAPRFVDALERASREPIDVMVHAILEPLKVRLITKGSTMRQWVAGHMQKALWGHLQRFPQFVLTGRTLDRFILSDLLERERSVAKRVPPGLGDIFTDWISGDYAAATDTLDIRHTKAVFEMALLHVDWSPKHQDVLRSVLYEQTIHYPKDAQPAFVQRTGQLMGSVLSFPVLCIVNLVTYWVALEEFTGMEFDLSELPVLINGDDILFRACDPFYELWQEKSRAAGFELSLGKNYTHAHYFTVNSELWSCSDGSPSTLTKHEFLNVGLLTGQSKITGRSNVAILPLWDLYNLVLKGAIDPVRAHRRFLHYHKHSISVTTSQGRFNIAAHKFKGGLGFESYRYPALMESTWAPRLTRFQKQIAHLAKRAILRDPKSLRGITLRATTEKGVSGGVAPTRYRLLPGPAIGPLLPGQFRKTRDPPAPLLSARFNNERIEVVSDSEYVRQPYELLRRFKQAKATHALVEDHDPFSSSQVPTYYRGSSLIRLVGDRLLPLEPFPESAFAELDVLDSPNTHSERSETILNVQLTGLSLLEMTGLSSDSLTSGGLQD